MRTHHCILLLLLLPLSPVTVSMADEADVAKHKSMHDHGATILSRHPGSRFAPSKPMSIVHFVKPQRYVASRGDRLEVSLTMMVSQPVDNLVVRSKAESGLVVVSSSWQSTSQLEAYEEVTVSFDVVAQGEGRRYINVLATADSIVGTRASSYSIPVEIGDLGKSAPSESTLRPASGKVIINDQGERLMLMPESPVRDNEQSR